MSMSTILTEDDEQILVVNYLRSLTVPHFHIPNQRKCPVHYRKKLKSMGVSSGVPDLCIPLPNEQFHGLFIEMKRQKKSKISKQQLQWMQTLNSKGYLCIVCRGFDDAKQQIDDYLRGIPNNK